MEQEKRYGKDPLRYLLYQKQSLTNKECDEAKNFGNKIFNREYCLLCEKKFDLTAKAPRILVHCGHCFCTSCLYFYFRDSRIKCPLCKNITKNLKYLEILPLNKDIHQKLMQELSQSEIDEDNKEFKYPGNLLEEVNQLDQGDQQRFKYCHIHANNFLSIMCLKCNEQYCRQCIKKRSTCDHKKYDLQILKPQLVAKIIDQKRNNMYCC